MSLAAQPRALTSKNPPAADPMIEKTFPSFTENIVSLVEAWEARGLPLRTWVYIEGPVC